MITWNVLEPAPPSGKITSCPTTAAVALGAGAHASRVDGAPLRYNREDPRLPDILVCHPMSASTLLSGIREVSGALP